MAELNPNDPRPPYVQIADDLREAIRTGEYPPGARLPSGRELAKRYGVALMTVTNAMDALKSDGLVESWQGRGAFVAGGVKRPGSADEVERRLAELEARVSTLESARRAKR